MATGRRQLLSLTLKMAPIAAHGQGIAHLVVVNPASFYPGERLLQIGAAWSFLRAIKGRIVRPALSRVTVAALLCVVER